MKISISSNISSIIKKSKNHLQQNISKQLNVLGKDLVKEAKSSMDETKSGRVYKINGGYHVASAVGESLANITGRAQNSITYFITGNILNFGGNNVALKVWESRALQQGKRPTLENAINKTFPIYKNKLGSIK